VDPDSMTSIRIRNPVPVPGSMAIKVRKNVFL
jgi:hypothetical protein